MQSLLTFTRVVSVPSGGSPLHLFPSAKVQQVSGFVGLANNASANTIIVISLDCLMSSS